MPERIERLLKRITAGRATFEDAAAIRDYVVATTIEMFCAGILVGMAMSLAAWCLFR